jgi:hypothetical protein
MVFLPSTSVFSFFVSLSAPLVFVVRGVKRLFMLLDLTLAAPSFASLL